MACSVKQPPKVKGVVGESASFAPGNESLDIFDDNILGGGVEPSIDESIRQSIQCSFVSSECNQTKQRYKE